MKIHFHPEAEQELNAAADWYEAQQTGLGADFSHEVRLTLRRAISMPTAWPNVAPGIRRVLTHRFPYGVLYAHRQDVLHVLAVMNLRREPDYWNHRVQP